MRLDDVLGTCGHAKFMTFTGWLKEDLSRDEIKISREKWTLLRDKCESC